MAVPCSSSPRVAGSLIRSRAAAGAARIRPTAARAPARRPLPVGAPARRLGAGAAVPRRQGSPRRRRRRCRRPARPRGESGRQEVDRGTLGERLTRFYEYRRLAVHPRVRAVRAQRRSARRRDLPALRPRGPGSRLRSNSATARRCPRSPRPCSGPSAARVRSTVLLGHRHDDVLARRRCRVSGDRDRRRE